jgi:hypothetical protein
MGIKLPWRDASKIVEELGSAEAPHLRSATGHLGAGTFVLGTGTACIYGGEGLDRARRWRGILAWFIQTAVRRASA